MARVWKALWRKGAGILASLLIILLAGPAHADYRLSEVWFSGLEIDDRADLQGNLVLLAHYGGMVDGEFGPGTYSAVVSWQRSIGAAQTGVLSPGDFDLIGQMASEVMSDLGISLVEDPESELAIMLPIGLLAERASRTNGTVYLESSGSMSAETFRRDASMGSLAQQYARAALTTPSKTVTYSTLRSDLYVVTGTAGGRYFYELVRSDGRGTVGFRFTYSEQFKEIGGIASVFAASYSAPMQARQAAREPATAAIPATAPSTPSLQLTLPPPDTGKQKQKTSSPAPELEPGVNEFGNFLTFDDGPGIIAMVGTIGPSTPLDFRRALRSMQSPPTALILASDGGMVSSALMVAYEVHELGISTYVMPELGCYSACAFIFLAGKERLAEGEVGVHQVWGQEADASSAQTVVSDILDAFAEFGVRQEVSSAMLRTLPEDMYIFSQFELTEWNVNTALAR